MSQPAVQSEILHKRHKEKADHKIERKDQKAACDGLTTDDKS